MIRTLATVFAGLLGLAFGSFLNVCLSRWPEGGNVVTPRSYCPACLRTLAWWENIPLLSWLALRGHCRTCRASIGVRHPIVELAMGCIWASVAWRIISQQINQQFDFPSEYAPLYIQFESAIATMLFCWVLVGLAVLDAEHFWLPDAVTLPGIVSGIAIYILVSTQLGWFFTGQADPKKALGDRVVAAFAGALLILFIRWIYSFFRHREGIGMGDVKLMAMLAAWLGFESALLSFALGVLLGAVVAFIVLAVPSKQRDPEDWALTKLPLGTFLCVGAIVSSLWGNQIIAAYRKWGGF